MVDLHTPLAATLDGEARAFLDAALGEVRSDAGRLPVLLPQLPRRLGRGPLGGDPVREGDLVVDLAAWRRCDAGAALLLEAAGSGDAGFDDLYQHGDLEERTMVLRALAVRPVTAGTVALLGEVQRTNTVSHVEAGACDSNLVARAVGRAGFGLEDFNRMVLKIAFLDLPLDRLPGAEVHANEELSRMLQDLATEREAAGRPVWADTDRLLARAPTAGSLARLVGGLEHGDDRRRRAAAEGVALLGRPELVPFATERLPREPRPEIRTALERITR